jgi:alpha-ribazole phosphatase/probable phosphoglycerate mutase
MPTTRIDLIRHGQPDGGNRFRGHGIDDPLSALGWEQMRQTARAIDDWQRIISSPMRRCLAFAEWLSQERGLALTVEQDFREVGFGSWEGVSRSELQSQRREEYDAFYRDPVHNRPPGAEPLAAFGQRVGRALTSLSAHYAGERLLVVAHAGVIRAAVGHVMQCPPAYWYQADVANAGLTRFVYEGDAMRLVIHNWRPSPN